MLCVGEATRSISGREAVLPAELSEVFESPILHVASASPTESRSLVVAGNQILQEEVIQMSRARDTLLLDDR